MKTIRNKILIVLLLILAQHGYSQGFINLGFESASLVSAGGFNVQFAPAFPGWIGIVGGVQQTIALSNTVYLDTSGISIINHGWSNPFAGLGYPYAGSGGLIQGNFTAILQAGVGLTMSDNTSLSQTGLVPADAPSLQFRVYQETDGSTPPGPFAVMLGGQTLSLVPLASGANYTMLGADIHSWANQTANLSFTLSAEQPHKDNQYLYLDSIVFSPEAVPEPSGIALFSLGALFLSFFRHRNSSR